MPQDLQLALSFFAFLVFFLEVENFALVLLIMSEWGEVQSVLLTVTVILKLNWIL